MLRSSPVPSSVDHLPLLVLTASPDSHQGLGICSGRGTGSGSNAQGVALLEGVHCQAPWHRAPLVLSSVALGKSFNPVSFIQSQHLYQWTVFQLPMRGRHFIHSFKNIYWHLQMCCRHYFGHWGYSSRQRFFLCGPSTRGPRGFLGCGTLNTKPKMTCRPEHQQCAPQ